jgi:hypothetical protein
MLDIGIVLLHSALLKVVEFNQLLSVMTYKPAFLSLTAIAVIASGCASKDPGQAFASHETELRHLGNYHFKVTTTSTQAQRAFDRGITLAYSFGYYAAEQEFRRVAEADPQCAMAYWGIALVNGPHINFPMVPPDHAEKA